MDVTQPRNAGMDGHEQALDLTRGIAAYVNHPLVAGLARVIAKHPQADIANAFNHKQVACKM
ncbi:class I SAM-dependent methyltransferase, partial [Mesorhizobium sp. M00.F.Ca.ET.038.03.1.1]